MLHPSERCRWRWRCVCIYIYVGTLKVEVTRSFKTLVSYSTKRGCIQKFPDWVDNEINNNNNNNNKHSLRSNTKGYGCKTHLADSQNSETTATSVRELFHWQFSVQAPSSETFGYSLVRCHNSEGHDTDFHRRGNFKSCNFFGSHLYQMHLINLWLFSSSFFLNRPLLPCGVEGFLLVNLLDNW
jgi:hypothetical protein